MANGGFARVIVYPQYGHNTPVNVRSKDVEPFIQRVLSP